MEDIGIVSWKREAEGIIWQVDGKILLKYASGVTEWCSFSPVSFGCKMNCYDLINCDGYMKQKQTAAF